MATAWSLHVWFLEEGSAFFVSGRFVSMAKAAARAMPWPWHGHGLAMALHVQLVTCTSNFYVFLAFKPDFHMGFAYVS